MISSKPDPDPSPQTEPQLQEVPPPPPPPPGPPVVREFRPAFVETDDGFMDRRPVWERQATGQGVVAPPGTLHSAGAVL